MNSGDAPEAGGLIMTNGAAAAWVGAGVTTGGAGTSSGALASGSAWVGAGVAAGEVAAATGDATTGVNGVVA